MYLLYHKKPCQHFLYKYCVAFINFKLKCTRKNMPISPKEISQSRVEFAVKKLIEIIDKKLKEHVSEENFQFTFNNNTDPTVKECVISVYESLGWIITRDHDSNVLEFSIPVTDDIKKPIEENNEEKIKLALESTEGKMALAIALVPTIKNNITQYSLTRKILSVDEIPLIQLSRYEKITDAKSYFMNRSETGELVCDCCSFGDELFVPTFETASNPTMRLNKRKKIEAVNQAQLKGSQSIARQEDGFVLKLLEGAADFDQTIYTYIETIKRAIEDSILEHKAFYFTSNKLVMNKKTFHAIRNYLDNYTFNVEGEDIKLDVLINYNVADNTIFVLPEKEFTGVLAVRQDITVLPADDTRRMRIGWVFFQEIGMAIMDHRAVRKIVVRF